MGCVYEIGTKKAKQVSVVKKPKPKTRFFSSLFGPGESSTPQRVPSPPPAQPLTDEAEYLELGQSGVELTIFTADVDVKLGPKMSAELHRSMRKNPPRALKYELIYVCHHPTQVSRCNNAPFRLGRTSMTQAEKGMTLMSRQRIVSSRASAQTWMGACVFQVHVPPLTLAQVCSRPCVHCEARCRYNEIIADMD